MDMEQEHFCEYCCLPDFDARAQRYAEKFWVENVNFEHVLLKKTVEKLIQKCIDKSIMLEQPEPIKFVCPIEHAIATTLLWERCGIVQYYNGYKRFSGGNWVVNVENINK